MDEKNTKWTAEDLTGAVKQVITDRSPLFESLINKLEDDETLRSLLYAMLFQGKKFLFIFAYLDNILSSIANNGVVCNAAKSGCKAIGFARTV